MVKTFPTQENQRSLFTNEVVITYKIYHEFARSVLKSVYTKLILLIAPWGGFLSSGLVLIIILLPVIKGGGVLESYSYLNIGDRIFVVFAFVFIALTIVGYLFAFIYSFDVTRVIANPFRTGHKSAFFSRSVDGKHVKYNVYLTAEVIKVDKDGEVTELAWKDIKGTRETSSFILLIQKGVGINTVVFRNFGKAYIESAVIITKDGFTQGDLQSFRDFLEEKRKKPMTKKARQRRSEFYTWRCPPVGEAIHQMRENRKKMKSVRSM